MKKFALIISIFLFFTKFEALSQDLDITFPSNRAVFQRNNGNAAIVYIAGNYRKKMDRIEARLIPLQGGSPVDWTTIVNTPFFGTYRGSLIVYGGWYQLQVRGWYNGQVIAESTLDRFGVGEVFVISGQSNAQGYFYNGQKGASDDRVNVVTNFYGESGSKPPYPVFGHLDAESVIAPMGKGAWYWGELGDMLAARLQVPVLFMNTAWEGFPVGEFISSWQGQQGVNPYSGNRAPAGYPYNSIADALNYYTNLTGMRAVLWHQGESDNYLSTSFEQYAQRLSTLIQASRNSSGKNISWMVARVSKDKNRYYQPVIDAQNFVISNTGNVFTGPNTDEVPDRTDGVHFSTSGFTKVAQQWAAQLNDFFFAASVPQFGNPPLQIQSYCGITNPSQPMLLSAPVGYVSYGWNNGSSNRTLEVGPGWHQANAKDVFGNVYFSAPIQFDQSLFPQKPTLYAEGPTEFCQGGSVSLITNLEGNNYWSNGAEGSRINATQSGSYFITHINQYSCGGTSDPININVRPAPVPQILSSGPLDICSNTPIILSSSIENGVTWNTGQTGNSIQVSQSGRFALRAVNEFGCEGTSDTVSVTIKPEAAQPRITNLGEDIFCADDSALLRVENLQNMRWNTGSTSEDLIVKSSGDYFATNTNEFGCTKNSNVISLVVNPIPERPQIEALGSLEVCDNETVKLRGSSAFGYVWSTGHTTREVEVKASNNIYLRTTNEFGCFSPLSDFTKVTILERPQNPQILQSGTFTLSSNFSSEAGNITYQWKLGETILDKNTEFIKTTTSGQYFLKGISSYTLQNGNVKTCESDLSPPFDYYLNSMFGGFSYYPNPITDGVLTIETLDDVDNATVSIFSLDGKPYFSENVAIFDRPKTFDVSKLPHGKYILKVRNNRSRFFGKIMIDK